MKLVIMVHTSDIYAHPFPRPRIPRPVFHGPAHWRRLREQKRRTSWNRRRPAGRTPYAPPPHGPAALGGRGAVMKKCRGSRGGYGVFLLARFVRVARFCSTVQYSAQQSLTPPRPCPWRKLCPPAPGVNAATILWGPKKLFQSNTCIYINTTTISTESHSPSLPTPGRQHHSQGNCRHCRCVASRQTRPRRNGKRAKTARFRYTFCITPLKTRQNFPQRIRIGRRLRQRVDIPPRIPLIPHTCEKSHALKITQIPTPAC